jgi:hypothetical protein
VIPVTSRPLLDLEPVGREADIDWLLATKEPRLLVGGPGSGKTFLLRHLMLRRDWNALFLVRPGANDAEIANAVRDLRPGIVVVDDAHESPSGIPSLVQLLRGIDSTVQIVASTWAGGKDAVLHAMGNLPARQVRTLEPLSRDQIVEVMEQAGLKVDHRTMGILVDQAANQPGLAVTIATLARQGAWQELSDGSALASPLSIFFDRFIGADARDVLASLSLGGDRGMVLEDVRVFLELKPGEASRVASGLASGGVLRELEGGVLAVWPRVLRSALLRTTFFSGSATALNFRGLLYKAPSLSKAVEAILSAIEVHGEIDREELRELARRAGSLRAWNQLAARSRVDGEWVLENYREDVRDVAGGTILNAPDLTIRKILAMAGVQAKAGERSKIGPFGPLVSWVRDLEVVPEKAIERRRILANAARDFLQAGGSPGIGLRAILLALSPNLKSSTLDPGTGNRISLRHSILPSLQIEQLKELWEHARAEVREIDSEGWANLTSAAWDWVFPEHAAMRDIDSGQRQALRDLGERVVLDLAHLAHSSPGLSTGFSEIATRLGIELHVTRDPIFDLLFSGPIGGDLADREHKRTADKEAVRRLAEGWEAEGPRAVAEHLAYYLAEGRRIGRIWNPNFGQLCEEIANAVQPVLPWFEALMEIGHEGAVVRPFLEALVKSGEVGWETALMDSLGIPSVTPVALEIALRSALPERLFSQALAIAPENTYVIRGMSSWARVPMPTLVVLLRHSSEVVALAAAFGEWDAEPRRQVRPEIMEEWRNAIIRSNATTAEGIGDLQEVLLSDSGLAAAWLAMQLEMVRPDLSVDLAITVAASLDHPTKAEFLRSRLADNELSFELAPALVGGDPERFRALLENPTGVGLHRRGLARDPDDAWAELVAVALEEKMPLADIVRGSYPRVLGLTVPYVGGGLKRRDSGG